MTTMEVRISRACEVVCLPLSAAALLLLFRIVARTRTVNNVPDHAF